MCSSQRTAPEPKMELGACWRSHGKLDRVSACGYWTFGCVLNLEHSMWCQSEMAIATRGRGFHSLTDSVASTIREAGLQTGLCHVFLRHTSASLCISENADPEVLRDLE